MTVLTLVDYYDGSMNSAETATITDVRHVPRRPSRRVVELDDGETVTLEASLVTRAGLRVGLPVDAGTLAELRVEDARLRAKAAALDMVRSREVSTQQVRTRLRRKGFEDEAIEFAVSSLTKLEYLSDERYAEEFVESRKRRNPRGRYGLQRELEKRGIARETIDRTLMALSQQDEHELAVQAARKQMRVYRTVTEDVARRRLHDFLVRRGFGYDIVRSVVSEVMGDGTPE